MTKMFSSIPKSAILFSKLNFVLECVVNQECIQILSLAPKAFLQESLFVKLQATVWQHFSVGSRQQQSWSYKSDPFLSITAFQERLAIATNASLLGLLLTKEKKNSDVVFQSEIHSSRLLSSLLVKCDFKSICGWSNKITLFG